MCYHHVTISAELRCLPFMTNVAEKLQEKCQQHYILPPQRTYGRAAPSIFTYYLIHFIDIFFSYLFALFLLFSSNLLC